MDLDNILRFERLQCTGDVARAGWVIDQDEVIKAMDMLGIEMPVHIRYMTGKYRYGTHKETKTHHKITLDQTTPFGVANFTLWHELVHAMQAERFAKEKGLPITLFYDEYKRGRGEWGRYYDGNKYELEANRLAARYEEMTLLAFTT